jgi:hypothetical protein
MTSPSIPTTVAQTATAPTANPVALLLVLGVGAVLALRRFTDIRPARTVAGYVPSISANRLLVGAAAIGLAVLFAAGDPRARVPLVVGLVLVGTFAILRDIGEYDPITFAMLAGVEVIIALSALGEPVIGSIANSDTGPLVVLVVGAIAWRLIGMYRERQKEQRERRITQRVRERMGGGR